MAGSSGVVIRYLNDYPKLVKDFNLARVAYESWHFITICK